MPTLTTPDLTKLERPKMEMPDFDLSKIDVTNLDLPKLDVGKAVAGAATAVGLMKPRRSRWPLLLGAGLAVGLAGWAFMNAAAIRDRLERAAAWATDKVNGMNTRIDDEDEALAFPSAETVPTTGSDYPDGFGAPAEMAGTNGYDDVTLDKVTAKS